VCTSPRLEVAGKTFLYQGQSSGHPYYREDIEGRSLPSSIPPAQTVNRKKREAFIGNLGTTTTARPPWNYGAHGGNTGWGRGTGTSTHTHTHTSTSHTSTSHTSSSGSINIPITRVNTGSSSSNSRSSSSSSSGWSRSRSGSSSSLGGRSRSSSSSSIGGRLGGSTPPPAPVPTFLYWHPTGNQWLMSPSLGGAVNEAEMAAKPTTTTHACPADVPQVWQTKEARTRSGRTVSWTEDPSINTQCKPDLMV